MQFPVTGDVGAQAMHWNVRLDEAGEDHEPRDSGVHGPNTFWSPHDLWQDPQNETVLEHGVSVVAQGAQLFVRLRTSATKKKKR
jgi:hypothetical protein